MGSFAQGVFEHERGMRVLLVGGSPERASAATVARAANGCTAVVAIDRGLDSVLSAGLRCDLFCGDVDSVSPAGALVVERAERGQEDFDVVRYNPHKDDTDLGLALSEVGRRWAGATVVATCFSGGNPDHALAVIGRFAAWGGKVVFAEDAFSGGVLRAGGVFPIHDAQGCRFSFVPLSPEAEVSETGMRWELDHRTVPLLDDLGISNVIEMPDARITCHKGTIACWLFS